LRSKQTLSLDVILNAISARRGIKIPITASLLADEIRRLTGIVYKVPDVKRLLVGLAVIVPAYMEMSESDAILLNVDPSVLVSEIRSQLGRLGAGAP
jgi:hypothetical protein